MPKVTRNRVKGKCPVCGNKVNGTGRIYCEGCQPPLTSGGGYIKLYRPEHPRANKGGYVAEHHLVMEEKIGRLLKDGEVVHHIDGNRTNNEPDNLMLFSSPGKHTVHHSLLNRRVVLSMLLSITSEQWSTAWALERDERRDFFKSLGVTNKQALNRAMVISGTGYVTYVIKRWDQYGNSLRKLSRAELEERFRSEFIQYALAEAAKVKR